jgi:hypothetical protein
LKKFRLDVSLLCFGLVFVAAVPVTVLRTKTYALGYEIGQKKQNEKVLIRQRDLLQQELAGIKHSIRTQALQTKTQNDTADSRLSFPEPRQILQHGQTP